MNCSICGGQMTKRKMDVDKTWKGRTITFRGIEADVCESCGTRLCEASGVAMMESPIESALDKPDYPEVMNVEEVSRFLRVTPQTVHNMLRDGRIAATKVGREWRFPKESLMKIFDLPPRRWHAIAPLRPVPTRQRGNRKISSRAPGESQVKTR